MARMVMLRTVVFRLVAALVVGGLIISAGLSILELRNAEAMLRISVTQNAAISTRNLQHVLSEGLHRQSRQEIRELVTTLLSQSPVIGARLTGGDIATLEVGNWINTSPAEVTRWVFPEHTLARGDEVDMRHHTLVVAPFEDNGKLLLLELIVDGPGELRLVHQRVLAQTKMGWLMLAVMTLMGLLLVRRWVTGPLSRVMGLLKAHAGPESFYALAKGKHDEFSQLAEAVGGMLTRLECTTDQLRTREQACQNLYQFAPAAMVSLDAQGKILEANRRAAELLAMETERSLIGLPLLDYIRTEDRPLLRQTIDRLNLDPAARCELRVQAAGKLIDVVVECTGVRDAEGALQNVHLSLLDVSEAKQLQRQLADQSHLLNLILDHISSAVLLVDNRARIAAYTRPLATLLKCQPQVMIGQRYDPARFWDELNAIDYELFVERLRQIDADEDRPAQERFETRAGVFLFQGVPVHDALGKPLGRLWVVQEITQQEQSQKLLDQQTHQLQALKRLGPQLSDVSDIHTLMERSCRQLFEIFQVETIGIAVRRAGDRTRSVQIIHRGNGAYLLETNRALVQAVEKHLMPEVLANHDVSLWPELSPTLTWSRAFTQAGLTGVAAGPMNASADAQGILWIARRAGERLERHHLYLLETLAPVIAARLEIVQLHERLHSVELRDSITGLPNQTNLEFETRKLANRPGHPWSLVVIKLDHFRKLNEMLEHQTNDQLLRRIGTTLQSVTRRSCFIARMAGPTFAIVSPGGTGEQAKILAERLRGVIAKEQVALPDSSSWPLTASVGAASSPDDGISGPDLLALACNRLELAKRSGGNRVITDGPGTPAAPGMTKMAG